MDEKHFQILEFLSNQSNGIAPKDFPDYIQDEFHYRGTIKDGSLWHEVEVVLRYAKKWVEVENAIKHTFIISANGKEALARSKREKFEALSNGQLKHAILGFLKLNSKMFFLSEIEEAFPIDKDTTLFLLDEMNSDGNIEMKNISPKNEINYTIKITPKGKGAFINKEYLKPQEQITPVMQISISGGITQIAGRDAHMKDVENQTTKSNEESKETKDLNKKSFGLNKWILIFTVIGVIVAIVSIIIGLRQ